MQTTIGTSGALSKDRGPREKIMFVPFLTAAAVLAVQTQNNNGKKKPKRLHKNSPDGAALHIGLILAVRDADLDPAGHSHDWNKVVRHVPGSSGSLPKKYGGKQIKECLKVIFERHHNDFVRLKGHRKYWNVELMKFVYVFVDDVLTMKYTT